VFSLLRAQVSLDLAAIALPAHFASPDILKVAVVRFAHSEHRFDPEYCEYLDEIPERCTVLRSPVHVQVACICGKLSFDPCVIRVREISKGPDLGDLAIVPRSYHRRSSLDWVVRKIGKWADGQRLILAMPSPTATPIRSGLSHKHAANRENARSSKAMPHVSASLVVWLMICGPRLEFGSIAAAVPPPTFCLIGTDFGILSRHLRIIRSFEGIAPVQPA